MSLFHLARAAFAHPLLAPMRPAAKGLLLASMPTPAPVRWAYRVAGAAVAGARRAAQRAAVFFWIEPAFRSRAAKAGRRLRLGASPRIIGPVRLEIGDDVSISGPIGVVTPPGAEALLVVGRGAFIGHGTNIHVARRVVIGDGAGIGARCYLADNDSHPHDLAARLRGEGAPENEIKPVTVGRHAWIGRECLILKGVTIGEGAIVGAGSVVVSDVPPWCIALGNPARVVARVAVSAGFAGGLKAAG